MEFRVTLSLPIAACFDDAGWHFPRMAGFSLEEFRARGLGTVVAKLTIEFHHEIRAGQLILIRGALARVGTKSFAHEMRFYEADSMTHCATQSTVEVCFDTAARKGVPLPEDIRQKLVAISTNVPPGATHFKVRGLPPHAADIRGAQGAHARRQRNN